MRRPLRGGGGGGRVEKKADRMQRRSERFVGRKAGERGAGRVVRGRRRIIRGTEDGGGGLQGAAGTQNLIKLPGRHISRACVARETAGTL